MTFVGFGKVEATAIRIDLGPSQVLTGQTSRIPFVDLNGTPIVGAASVDFLFKNNQFVRLFADSSVGFHGLIVLETNGREVLGFLDGTGYLIDAQGNAIPGYRVTGTASGDDGTLSIGAFPILADETGAAFDRLRRPLDFHGIHYDFTFPNRPLNAVMGGEFFLAGNGKPYGIGPGPNLPPIPTPTPVPTPAPLQLMAAVSRQTHGSAGTFDITLPLTGQPGVECRNAGGNYIIVLDFNNSVVRAGVSITSGTGSVETAILADREIEVNLTGVIDQQRIEITLSNLTDTFSQTLASATVSVDILIGDTTGNKTVNSTDFSQTKAQSGQALTEANFRKDVNVNGQINGSDASQVKAHVGAALP